MSIVSHLLLPKPRTRREITAKERLQCSLSASLNEGYAELCTPDQATLRKVFEENAALLRSLAQ